MLDKTVVPILTYGCEIWGFDNVDILQKVQLRFYKIVLKFVPENLNSRKPHFSENRLF